jgi:hypothetical protein
MSEHPVHYAVERPTELSRLQLAIRVVAFLAVGAIGLSFGTIFVFAYLALPVFAASRLAGGRDPAAYLDADGPRVVGVLGWFAAVSAWAALVTDRLPTRSPSETIHLHVVPAGRPDARSAIGRVLTGLPSALVLALLGCVGVLVWLWAALSVLFTRRVGPLAFQYLIGLQRWSIRLLVYQASLVDEYPPFSLADEPAALPAARVSP